MPTIAFGCKTCATILIHEQDTRRAKNMCLITGCDVISLYPAFSRKIRKIQPEAPHPAATRKTSGSVKGKRKTRQCCATSTVRINPDSAPPMLKRCKMINGEAAWGPSATFSSRMDVIQNFLERTLLRSDVANMERYFFDSVEGGLH